MLQEAASKIMRQMGRDSNQINRIYPMPFFRAEVGKMVSLNDTISESDLQIILAYLSREKSAIVYNDHVSWIPSPIYEHLVTTLLARQV